MARPPSEHPTDLELEILKILWHDSPLPVRDVRERLKSEAGRTLAHSSVITVLNIMYDKGFLTRRKSGKAFLFAPKVKKQSVTSRMMGDMLNRVFDGSPVAMMLNLIDTAGLDAEELAELRRLINRKRKEQQG